MKLKSSNKDLGEIAIEDIADLLSDLENINSFFILEKGNCSYIQCISYNGFIIIEERIYEDDSFNHYVLGHIEDCNCKINMDKTNNDKTSNGKTNSDKKNNNKANIGKNSLKDSLAIDDENFKIYNNETFTIREAIDIFTDYYSNFPLNYLKRRNI
ncbi:MAG: hypothetical protein LBM26_03610, partial [Methanobrevibacter sp.]|nr:hypothetical protein [Methanobrevibacter sp.]